MKNILTVVGTRPNIIKITQFHKVISQYPNIKNYLVHTGQHFSANMNDLFFEELQLPLPDKSFDIDRTSIITQMSDMMLGLEKVVNELKPDLMLVVGDVNSTLAATLVANKLNIKLAHIESGLRSFDKTMPEEHNRLVTDSMSDYFFVTEQSGYDNLIHEGKNKENIFFVGNTMIDTLVAYDAEIKASGVMDRLGLKAHEYCLMTMHRPGNVDEQQGLEKLVDLIAELCQKLKVVFPIHPRTLNNIKKFNLYSKIEGNKNLVITEPAGYLDFQNLILNCKYVVTDSGGIQEETTFRQVPCITLRPNTERPVTCTIGSNTLCEFELDQVFELIRQINEGEYKKGEIPNLWDGKATERIFRSLDEKILNN
jgi:UDP-N-acetylglucosamine 2-epimerase (non-hydrolysing)